MSYILQVLKKIIAGPLESFPVDIMSDEDRAIGILSEIQEPLSERILSPTLDVKSFGTFQLHDTDLSDAKKESFLFVFRGVQSIQKKLGGTNLTLFDRSQILLYAKATQCLLQEYESDFNQEWAKKDETSASGYRIINDYLENVVEFLGTLPSSELKGRSLEDFSLAEVHAQHWDVLHFYGEDNGTLTVGEHDHSSGHYEDLVEGLDQDMAYTVVKEIWATGRIDISITDSSNLKEYLREFVPASSLAQLKRYCQIIETAQQPKPVMVDEAMDMVVDNSDKQLVLWTGQGAGRSSLFDVPLGRVLNLSVPLLDGQYSRGLAQVFVGPNVLLPVWSPELQELFPFFPNRLSVQLTDLGRELLRRLGQGQEAQSAGLIAASGQQEVRDVDYFVQQLKERKDDDVIREELVGLTEEERRDLNQELGRRIDEEEIRAYEMGDEIEQGLVLNGINMSRLKSFSFLLHATEEYSLSLPPSPLRPDIRIAPATSPREASGQQEVRDVDYFVQQLKERKDDDVIREELVGLTEEERRDLSQELESRIDEEQERACAIESMDITSGSMLRESNILILRKLSLLLSAAKDEVSEQLAKAEVEEDSVSASDEEEEVIPYASSTLSESDDESSEVDDDSRLSDSSIDDDMLMRESADTERVGKFEEHFSVEGDGYSQQTSERGTLFLPMVDDQGRKLVYMEERDVEGKLKAIYTRGIGKQRALGWLSPAIGRVKSRIERTEQVTKIAFGEEGLEIERESWQGKWGKLARSTESRFTGTYIEPEYELQVRKVLSRFMKKHFTEKNYSEVRKNYQDFIFQDSERSDSGKKLSTLFLNVVRRSLGRVQREERRKRPGRSPGRSRLQSGDDT